MIISRPEFYTAYTPYQPEVSQGTLQAIFEFQSFIAELTGLSIANASMYDGGTAAAEAVLLCWKLKKRPKIAISSGLNPEYIEIIKTYLRHTPAELLVLPLNKEGRTDFSEVPWSDVSAGIVASPNFFGVIEDLSDFSRNVHSGGGLAICSVNPISLGILKNPGTCGIDLAVGNGQVLGNKITFGGPSFGFFASTEALLRNLPGRLIGKTTDKDGLPSYVMTLQTREQHIRRENATSNICTNQALNALAGTVYLSVLGKNGIRSISKHNLMKAHYLMEKLVNDAGVKLLHKKEFIFNEFVYSVDMDGDEYLKRLKAAGIFGGIHLKKFNPELRNKILCAVTETKTKEDLDMYVSEVKHILKV